MSIQYWYFKGASYIRRSLVGKLRFFDGQERGNDSFFSRKLAMSLDMILEMEGGNPDWEACLAAAR